MLRYAIIGGLILLVLVCIVILFRMQPEDAPKRKLPEDLQKKQEDRTHFYEAVHPDQKRELPPVPPSSVRRPQPPRSPRHSHDDPRTQMIQAIEPQTEFVRYGPFGA